jgi:DNA-binding response OmpR family regulator
VLTCLWNLCVLAINVHDWRRLTGKNDLGKECGKGGFLDSWLSTFSSSKTTNSSNRSSQPNRKRRATALVWPATARRCTPCLNGDQIELILLDLGLPDEDGLVLARQTRSRSNVPIIVITARKDRADRLTALEVGADDYITKPFDPEELILRVQNILGRAGSGANSAVGRTPSNIIAFDGWTIGLGGRTLTDPNAQEVVLTRSEFNLLSALAKAPNRVLTRDHLLDAIGTHDRRPDQPPAQED